MGEPCICLRCGTQSLCADCRFWWKPVADLEGGMVAVPRRCTPVIIGPGVQIKARIKRAARMNIEWTDETAL